MILKTIPQQTVGEPVAIKGVGLHTGAEATLSFKPAPVNTGLVFVRTDLTPPVEVKASVKYVVNTERSTSLEKEGVKIQTTEHVLAALTGLSIDNCYIEVDNAELPIMDGSAKCFVEVLQKVGVVEQEELREEFVVDEIIRYEDEVSGGEMLLLPAECYALTVMVDYETEVLGTQHASINDISEFSDSIASARTFCFLSELEMLLEHSLIKGGSLNNAIVYTDKLIAEDKLEHLRKVFKNDKISVAPNGILNNVSLHYPNEAARHKLLDVIGDLALAEIPIRGKVIANKPGHKINTKFANKISQIARADKRLNVPNIGLNSPPLMDVNAIMGFLPHRPPFLLVDKIYELSEKHVVGVKNITMNEPHFMGHFPGNPVMPGVLQIESMAQVGGILALSTVPDPENYLTFFMKIVNAKFKLQIHPGDTLISRLELLAPIRRGICHMRGVIFANRQIASEAELMAQIIRKDKVE